MRPFKKSVQKANAPRKRALYILRLLKKNYPVRGPFVKWRNELELVVGTVLSAQCTDERVNKVTKALFRKYKTAEDYTRANLQELEKDIYSTGFYRSKARYLKGIAEILLKKFKGKVPVALDDLLTLPGVASKTANLVMAKAFGKFTGVAVDTHVFRIAPRLGWTRAKNAKDMARDLEKLFPKEKYLEVNEYLIVHGRSQCTPKPKCLTCVVRKQCPSAEKFYPELKSNAGE